MRFGRFLGRSPQHEPMQDRLPRDRMDFDHPPIAEELGEIAAHRALLRGIGGAEVDQQHADLALGNSRMVGGRHAAAIGSKGRTRIRLPDPAWIALATAGARGKQPRPLTPPDGSLLEMISTTTSGASARRGSASAPSGRARGTPPTHPGPATVAR